MNLLVLGAEILCPVFCDLCKSMRPVSCTMFPVVKFNSGVASLTQLSPCWISQLLGTNIKKVKITRTWFPGSCPFLRTPLVLSFYCNTNTLAMKMLDYFHLYLDAHLLRFPFCFWYFVTKLFKFSIESILFLGQQCAVRSKTQAFQKNFLEKGFFGVV